MERLMRALAPAGLTYDLHQTNARLRILIEALHPGPVTTPQQMAGLLSELMRAGAQLRALPDEKQSELETELSEYRLIVERLRMFLPMIQSALLQEKSRLEKERSRLRGAAEWAGRSQQTL